MKKERKLKLEVNKVSVSKLNNVFGGGDDLIPSVNFLCVVTTEVKTIPDEDCKTYVTLLNTADRC